MSRWGPGAIIVASWFTIFPLAAGCGTVDDPVGRSGAEVSTPSETKSPSRAASTKAEPSRTGPSEASGITLRAPGLEVTVPRGWDDIGARADVILSAARLTNDDVPQVMTVSRMPSTVTKVDRIRSLAEEELRLSGHRDIRSGWPRVRIDGAIGSRVSAVKPGTQPPQAIERFDVATGGYHWSITFSASRWASATDRRQTIESILATWRWNSPVPPPSTARCPSLSSPNDDPQVLSYGECA
jgi:hypothetical protein